MILFIVLTSVVLIFLFAWLWVERSGGSDEPRTPRQRRIGAEYRPPGAPPPIE